MARIRLEDSDKDIFIPDIEVSAALKMSRNTAQREGFPRTAAQVQRYIDEVDAEVIRLQDIRNLNWKLRDTILGSF